MVTTGKPGEQKRGACLYGGEEVGGVILNKSPLQKSKSFKVIVTYWMSSCRARRKIFFLLLLLGFVKDVSYCDGLPR